MTNAKVGLACKLCSSPTSSLSASDKPTCCIKSVMFGASFTLAIPLPKLRIVGALELAERTVTLRVSSISTVDDPLDSCGITLQHAAAAKVSMACCSIGHHGQGTQHSMRSRFESEDPFVAALAAHATHVMVGVMSRMRLTLGSPKA